MCGGFVAFYSGSASASGQASGARNWSTHLCYNLGRLFTYLSAGGLAGALGGVFDRTLLPLGVERASAIILGAIMISWGVIRLRGGKGLVTNFNADPAEYTFFSRIFRRGLQSCQAREAHIKALIIGLLSTLLPCGWLYAYLAVAASSGSATWGAISMFVFWCGTVPIMLSLGYALRSGSSFLFRHTQVLTSVLLIVAGLYSMSVHLDLLPGEHASHHHQHH